jgi:soluble lytic murein transglycosylase-like protein
MMRLLSLVLIFAALAGGALAQSLDDYLKLRRQHGIERAAGIEALETLIGTRILEIEGVVKGTFRVGDKGSIMLERSNGATEIVEAASIPDWMIGNEVSARLIVQASRSNEFSPLRARLLGAASAGAVERVERETLRQREAAAKQAQAAPRSAPTRTQTSVASRHAGRPVGAQEWVAPRGEVVTAYASFIKGQNRRLSNAEAIRIAEGIVGFSIRYGVDARLIMAMVMVESGFNPSATSRAGAMGLGQLMPGTARWMGVSNAYDTTENLYGTVKLVRTHLDQYSRKTGDEFEQLVLTLAAYNAGAGAVRRHGGVPPFRETQNYVRKVIEYYRAFTGG